MKRDYFLYTYNNQSLQICIDLPNVIMPNELCYDFPILCCYFCHAMDSVLYIILRATDIVDVVSISLEG